MSSTRWIVNTLKFTSIAGANLTMVGLALEQNRRNQEIIKNMPEAERAMLAQDPVNKLGNSGDALAVFNERLHRYR